MSELIQTDTQNRDGLTHTKDRRPFAAHLVRIVREFVAVVFWMYVVVKLFIYDFDIYLAHHFSPSYAWIIDLKFFAIISVLAIIWFFTKSSKLLFWVLYVLAYPLIFLFWKVPYLFFKLGDWNLILAFINSLISFFKSVRYNFITASVFFVTAALIILVDSRLVLWASVITIILLLFVFYVRRFVQVFEPSTIMQLSTKLCTFARKHTVNSVMLDESVKNLPVETLTESQLQKWTTSLQAAVLYNRVCLFTAKKLRGYQNSGWVMGSHVMTLLLLVMLTILCFAFVNLALFRINDNFFVTSGTPTIFGFVYFSFKTLTFGSIQEIVPTMPISKTISMIESLFAFFLGAIFVSLVVSVKSQRHIRDLGVAIDSIEAEGQYMEGIIQNEYRLSVGDAISALERVKSFLIDFIFKLSK